MPESKSGALPLGDIPVSEWRPGSDTLGIVAQVLIFGNLFFENFAVYSIFPKST